MARLFLTVSGALLIGAASWFVTAFGSAKLLERGPGGTREGANAMAAAFFIGPIGAVIGLALGGWFLWRLSADPSRHGGIGLALAGAFVALLVGGIYAFSPTYDPGIQWPKGMKGEAQVEVRMPAARLPEPSRDALSFDLRCGAGTLQTRWDPKSVRREGGLALIPAAFTLRDRQTGWVFAVMQRDTQIGVADIDLREPLTETSPWTEWRPMEGDMEFRYRTAVVPR